MSNFVTGFNMFWDSQILGFMVSFGLLCLVLVIAFFLVFRIVDRLNKNNGGA